MSNISLSYKVTYYCKIELKVTLHATPANWPKPRKTDFYFMTLMHIEIFIT